MNVVKELGVIKHFKNNFPALKKKHVKLNFMEQNNNVF